MEREACEQKKKITVAFNGECDNGASRLGFPGISFMLAFLAFVWFSF